ncbi:hypothetical protein Sfulv_17270 [Streptomyces fulvorobeus]|uniref:aspartate kinase n=1 Tax=Streptomyces fulvorobeus TaxID=284028 RepID=A0A7J0C5D4_9ACTN|nr:hypothetical protein Sfulv_17270 [Streptomyces fulvorobeus]
MEMLEMAAAGAKVLMPRCVEYAHRHGVDVHVRSSFTDRPGTLVSHSSEGDSMEGSCITGVAHLRSVAQITVCGLSADPSATTSLFEVLAEGGIPIDMVQRSRSAAGHTMAFTVPASDGPRATDLLKQRRENSGDEHVSCDLTVSQVSLVGVGIGAGRTSIVARLCRTLTEAGIDIGPIAASELRISLLCPAGRLDEAVRALHRDFGLDGATEGTVEAGAIR